MDELQLHKMDEDGMTGLHLEKIKLNILMHKAMKILLTISSIFS
jgi:hypothetical protein